MARERDWVTNGRQDSSGFFPPALIGLGCVINIPPIRMIGKPEMTKVVTKPSGGTRGIERIPLIPPKPTEMVNNQC
jgi:hypothetical protein